MSDLLIYWRAWGATEWKRIDSKVSKKPASKDRDESKLRTFSFSLNDPKDDLGNRIVLANGDDIVIPKDTTTPLTEIFEEYIGRISTVEQTLKAKDSSNNLIYEYDFEVMQRDPSMSVFSLEYTTSFLLSDFMDYITGSGKVRADQTEGIPLGGTLADTTVIPPYVILSEDITIDSYPKLKGSTMKQLQEFCSQNNHDWNMKHYIESDGVNVLNAFQQIQIWS
jgi:hypothetical protein